MHDVTFVGSVESAVMVYDVFDAVDPWQAMMPPLPLGPGGSGQTMVPPTAVAEHASLPPEVPVSPARMKSGLPLV